MNNIYWFYGLLFLGAVLFQTTLIDFVQVMYMKPDLILILVVIIGMRHGAVVGSTAGFFGGILSDLISSGLFGLGALGMAVAGHLAALIPAWFKEGGDTTLSKLVRFLITFFLSGVVHDIIYFTIGTIGSGAPWLESFALIIPNLFYSALFGVLIYFAVTKVIREYE